MKSELKYAYKRVMLIIKTCAVADSRDRLIGGWKTSHESYRKILLKCIVVLPLWVSEHYVIFLFSFWTFSINRLFDYNKKIAFLFEKGKPQYNLIYTFKNVWFLFIEYTYPILNNNWGYIHLFALNITLKYVIKSEFHFSWLWKRD